MFGGHSEADFRHMNSKPLAGKTAVVTGGGRGIGAAIARKLAELGAMCVITGRNLDRLQRMAAESASSASVRQ